MIYVVIACHFKSASELCETTIARLQKAFEVAGKGSKFVVTGNVPYGLGTKTLGELMRGWLEEHRVPSNSIEILRGGVGMFSEARLVSASLERSKEIVVVSSPWYFFYAKPIWCRRARENGQKIHFISVTGTGGWRTWVTYIALGLAVRVSILLGVERVLEDRLTASQGNRRNEFKFNGCR